MHADADPADSGAAPGPPAGPGPRPGPGPAERRGLTTKGKVKLAGIVIAIVVAAVLVLQNTAAVETRLFFITIEMPRVVLLLLMLAIGFVLGAVFGRSLRRRRGA